MFNSLILFLKLGVFEILLILLIILLLFGSTLIPKLVKSIKYSIKEFKAASDDDKETNNDDNSNKEIK